MEEEVHYEDYIDLALKVADAAHFKQFRWNGDPYITHPIRVSEMVHLPVCKVVALLHDVVEDTSVGLNELAAHGFTNAVIYSVDVLTRHNGQSYVDYINKIKFSDIARVVKIADLEDNLRDLKKGSLRDKYELALQILKRG